MAKTHLTWSFHAKPIQNRFNMGDMEISDTELHVKPFVPKTNSFDMEVPCQINTENHMWKLTRNPCQTFVPCLTWNDMGWQEWHGMTWNDMDGMTMVDMEWYGIIPKLYITSLVDMEIPCQPGILRIRNPVLPRFSRFLDFVLPCNSKRFSQARRRFPSSQPSAPFPPNPLLLGFALHCNSKRFSQARRRFPSSGSLPRLPGRSPKHPPLLGFALDSNSKRFSQARRGVPSSGSGSDPLRGLRIWGQKLRIPASKLRNST